MMLLTRTRNSQLDISWRVVILTTIFLVKTISTARIGTGYNKDATVKVFQTEEEASKHILHLAALEKYHLEKEEANDKGITTLNSTLVAHPVNESKIQVLSVTTGVKPQNATEIKTHLHPEEKMLLLWPGGCSIHQKGKCEKSTCEGSQNVNHITKCNEKILKDTCENKGKVDMSEPCGEGTRGNVKSTYNIVNKNLKNENCLKEEQGILAQLAEKIKNLFWPTEQAAVCKENEIGRHQLVDTASEEGSCRTGEERVNDMMLNRKHEVEGCRENCIMCPVFTGEPLSKPEALVACNPDMPHSCRRRESEPPLVIRENNVDISHGCDGENENNVDISHGCDGENETVQPFWRMDNVPQNGNCHPGLKPYQNEDNEEERRPMYSGEGSFLSTFLEKIGSGIVPFHKEIQNNNEVQLGNDCSENPEESSRMVFAQSPLFIMKIPMFNATQCLPGCGQCPTMKVENSISGPRCDKHPEEDTARICPLDSTLCSATMKEGNQLYLNDYSSSDCDNPSEVLMSSTQSPICCGDSSCTNIGNEECQTRETPQTSSSSSDIDSSNIAPSQCSGEISSNSMTAQNPECPTNGQPQECNSPSDDLDTSCSINMENIIGNRPCDSGIQYSNNVDNLIGKECNTPCDSVASCPNNEDNLIGEECNTPCDSETSCSNNIDNSIGKECNTPCDSETSCSNNIDNLIGKECNTPCDSETCSNNIDNLIGKECNIPCDSGASCPNNEDNSIGKECNIPCDSGASCPNNEDNSIGKECNIPCDSGASCPNNEDNLIGKEYNTPCDSGTSCSNNIDNLIENSQHCDNAIDLTTTNNQQESLSSSISIDAKNQESLNDMRRNYNNPTLLNILNVPSQLFINPYFNPSSSVTEDIFSDISKEIYNNSSQVEVSNIEETSGVSTEMAEEQMNLETMYNKDVSVNSEESKPDNMENKMNEIPQSCHEGIGKVHRRKREWPYNEEVLKNETRSENGNVLLHTNGKKENENRVLSYQENAMNDLLNDMTEDVIDDIDYNVSDTSKPDVGYRNEDGTESANEELVSSLENMAKMSSELEKIQRTYMTGSTAETSNEYEENKMESVKNNEKNVYNTFTLINDTRVEDSEEQKAQKIETILEKLIEEEKKGMEDDKGPYDSDVQSPDETSCFSKSNKVEGKSQTDSRPNAQIEEHANK